MLEPNKSCKAHDPTSSKTMEQAIPTKTIPPDRFPSSLEGNPRRSPSKKWRGKASRRGPYKILSAPHLDDERRRGHRRVDAESRIPRGHGQILLRDGENRASGKEASTAGNDTLRKKSALLRIAASRRARTGQLSVCRTAQRTPSARAVIPTIARFGFRVNQKPLRTRRACSSPWAMNDFPI